MKTNIPFFYLSCSFLLRMRNISDKTVEKIKTLVLWSVTFFFRKSCLLWDNVEEDGTARQAKDDGVTRRMRIAYWTTKATNTQSDM